MNFSLNYNFVVSTPGSANQIFELMPRGLAYGLGIEESTVMAYAIMPYDTTSSLHYITTLVMAYVPSASVDQLQLDVHTPVSPLYNNPQDSVSVLMSMVNPAIPILPGSTLAGSNPYSSTSNPSAESTSETDGGAPIGGDSGASSKVKSSSVGIGVGAVAGAAVYAAAMVYVARRYRKKRARHQRVASIPSARPTMSQRSSNGMGAYFMAGANGRGGSGSRGSRQSGGSTNARSVREAGISGPVTAENSLGWN